MYYHHVGLTHTFCFVMTANAAMSDLPTDMLTEIVDRGILCEITRLEHVLSVGYSTVMTKAKFIKCLRHMVDLLCSLSRVNREMHRFATSSRCAPHWEALLRFWASCEDEHLVTGRDVKTALEAAEAVPAPVPALEERGNVAVSASKARTYAYKRALLLVAGTGCQICGAARVRKVRWGYLEHGQGVRCCKPCLIDRTVSDYRLINDFGLCYHPRRSFILDEAPHVMTELYSPRIGGYTLNFYWIADVLVRTGLADSFEQANRLSPSAARHALAQMKRDGEARVREALLERERAHLEKSREVLDTLWRRRPRTGDQFVYPSHMEHERALTECAQQIDLCQARHRRESEADAGSGEIQGQSRQPFLFQTDDAEALSKVSPTFYGAYRDYGIMSSVHGSSLDTEVWRDFALRVIKDVLVHIYIIQSVHLKMKRLFFVFVPIFFSCYRELKVCTI